MTWKLIVSYRNEKSDEDILVVSETLTRLIDLRYALRALVQTLMKFGDEWKPDANWKREKTK
jgi:hypothetical protein